MPYNIPGETPAITKKMERCVADLVADTDFKPKAGRTKKESAIAVCKASVMGTTKKKGRAIKVRKKIRKLKRG